MATIHDMGMGWHRDLPDIRDYTDESDTVHKVLQKSAALKKVKAAKKMPASVDLRKWCSPIENQGSLGSCTAHAGVGMMEYYERRAFGRHLDASRLFLYKVTRNLLGFTGDDGAYLRDTMKGMVLFGVPPEKYWPYKIKDFNVEPTQFCYAFAQSYQAVKYYRPDPPAPRQGRCLRRSRRRWPQDCRPCSASRCTVPFRDPATAPTGAAHVRPCAHGRFTVGLDVRS
jgi:C1A family cysteine protease